MSAFLRYFRRLHIWLLANVLLLSLFYVLRSERNVMNAAARYVIMPLEQAMGRLCALVPFSVAELCYAAVFLGVPIYLVCCAFAIRRAEYTWDAVYRSVMRLVNVGLSLFAALCLLWGVIFSADDFCDRSGIRAEPVAREDLISVTRYFARQASAHADQVARDADGVYAVPREDSLRLAPTLYEGMYEEFPFLYLAQDPMPKKIFFSPVMSAMNVTGLYFPLTGESNLNMDFPAATFPATVAHELAHRRGIASEQQCNFVAVLASTRSADEAYRYSGWLFGYIHLSNALYSADPEAWQEIRQALAPGAEADLRAANEYWAHYEGAVSNASEKAYDAMLRGYGDELGIRSYGAVADLLVAYYKEAAVHGSRSS